MQRKALRSSLTGLQTPRIVTRTQPVYIRVTDASLMYGLSRTRLFALMAQDKIKSKYVIQPGKKRGIRLILDQSLRDYLESFSGSEVTA